MRLNSLCKKIERDSVYLDIQGCSNEMGALGPGYEQGSSWAVEVGGHMKICPIVVENINMNGQMLIEVGVFRVYIISVMTMLQELLNVTL